MVNRELKFEDKPDKPADGKGKGRGVFDRLKKVKNIEIYVAIIAVAVMLVIYFSSRNSPSVTNAESETPYDYCRKMETELTDTLSSLKNAGKTKVIINWESSVEAVIAYITNNGANSSTSTPQIIQSNGSSKPVVLKEIYPKALGVIIICEGGDKVDVKLDIINAVSVLLNITPDKISVYAMSKSK